MRNLKGNSASLNNIAQTLNVEQIVCLWNENPSKIVSSGEKDIRSVADMIDSKHNINIYCPTDITAIIYLRSGTSSEENPYV